MVSLLLVFGVLAAGCGGGADTTTTAGGGHDHHTCQDHHHWCGADNPPSSAIKIEATEQTPPDFAEALKQQKPLAVLFYRARQRE